MVNKEKTLRFILITSVLACVSIFYDCSDTYDWYDDPSLIRWSAHSSQEVYVFIDSMKVSQDDNQNLSKSLSFSLFKTGELALPVRIGMDKKGANSTVSINGQEINSESFVNIEKQSVIHVVFKPLIFVPGKVELSLYSKTNQGTGLPTEYTIVLFDNLPPVALFTAKHIGPDGFDYQFDATNSYDADHRYGGRIVWYKYEVTNQGGNQTVLVKIPITNYAFPAKGQYLITLQVTDSDGAIAQSNAVQVILP